MINHDIVKDTPVNETAVARGKRTPDFIAQSPELHILPSHKISKKSKVDLTPEQKDKLEIAKHIISENSIAARTAASHFKSN